MLDTAVVDREIIAYRMKLFVLLERYRGGERQPVGREASHCADALICLMDEAPLPQRPAINYLVDRYESLRASCLRRQWRRPETKRWRAMGTEGKYYTDP